MTILGTSVDAPSRIALVRRGTLLGYLTVGYNSLEAVIALVAGAIAGSVALVGFGADSVIELAAGATALWRFSRDWDHRRREHTERVAHRIVGMCFIVLAIYVAWESVGALLGREAPDESLPGIILAAASLVVMPLLAWAKRKVALALRSGALVSEAKQTALCTYLSAILLAGLVLNALLGWWWADPLAGLAMVPLIAWEGWEGLRGRSSCVDECC